MERNHDVEDEPLQRAERQARLTPSFIALMASSGVLAAVAFAVSSIPILLGAMIVAPLMPTIALFVLGVVGGHMRLGFRGLGIALIGLLVAAGATALTALLFEPLGFVDSHVRMLTAPLVEERLRPGWYSLLAAVAAGVAGMIGFRQRKTDTIIGTVASVALVPAAGAAGIALAAGDHVRALGGAALTTINLLTIGAVGIAVSLVVRAYERRAGVEPKVEEEAVVVERPA